MRRFAAALAGILCAAQLQAQERILSYDTEVDIRRDGTLNVTERITVRAEGNQIRRGIYRDFPTRYRDRFGNRVRVALDVRAVERNGVIEPWFTERMDNGVRINTGGDDFLPVPAEYTYTLHYRTTRQLGFFDSHDELYWNAIGTGWIFPIEKGSVEVRLPSQVPMDQMSAEAYTGPQGARGTAYSAELPEPGVARYRLTAPLAPYEGLTTVLSFPKGVVTAPTRSDRMRWFLEDNRGVLIALAGLIVLLIYCVVVWRAVGRDPSKGIVIARYDPEPGHTPAGLRYMQRMGYDMRCFTGDILALAVGGHVRIHRQDRFFKDEWQLERLRGAAAKAPEISQRMLLDTLFRDGADILALKDSNASTISTAKESHKSVLNAEFHPRYFKRNTGRVTIAVLIAAVAAAIAFAASGGFGIPAIIATVVLMVITIASFAYLVRAPTREGRALLDEIEGLRLYMSVAERDELARMPGPSQPPVLDAARYEAMLPFAVALDVEDAWTRKFTAAVGAAAAAAAASGMRWYAGRGPVTDIGSFTSSIGSSLSSTISSASTPPGSSSGSGGGGSSGGGGGGGGGGGR